MVPPLGSILIGPCPLCREMVVLFSGKVMALDKKVMLGNDDDAKRKHLTDVLNSYVSDRVEEVLSGADLASFSVENESNPEFGQEDLDEKEFEREFQNREDENNGLFDEILELGPISQEEVADFLQGRGWKTPNCDGMRRQIRYSTDRQPA